MPTSSSSNILASADQNADEASARNVAKVNFSELDKIAELAEAEIPSAWVHHIFDNSFFIIFPAINCRHCFLYLEKDLEAEKRTRDS